MLQVPKRYVIIRHNHSANDPEQWYYSIRKPPDTDGSQARRCTPKPTILGGIHMIYLINPQDIVINGCTLKQTCHPKFYPMYGVPV